MTLKHAFIILIASFVFPAASEAGAAPDGNALNAKVSALLQQMTLEEKVGQLVQYSSSEEVTGPHSQSNVAAEIRAGRCGSMLNVVGADATRAMQDIAMKESRLKIPLLFGYDVIHGFRTIFPQNLGQSASWDLEAIESAERIAATEAASAGVHWTFAPMVDIARDPRWGRIAEGSGEDPFLGAAIARARVLGFQGGDLSRKDTVMACVKHYAAYGAAQAGRDYFTTDVPEITLRDVYLPPFRAAIEAGAGSLMPAFNDLNGVPCSANSFLLTQVLRKEWGFDGLVVSDWMAIQQLIAHGIAADEREACLKSMNAGMDMDMEGLVYLHELAGLVKNGQVSMTRLDAAVTAVLLAKARLGLLDDPYRYCDSALEARSQLMPASLAAARELARKSCVLLKNEKKILPLAKGLRIALVGPLADSKRGMLGSWTAQGKESEAITLRAALEERFPSAVTYAQGCAIQGDSRDGFAAAKKAARRADIVIAVLGERWDMTGEGSCRTDLDLPGNQQALLEMLHATGTPVVVVLMTGRPLTLEKALPFMDALLIAWYPGTKGGPAVVDVLTGAYNPSGKLTVSFPRSTGQIPIFYGHKATGRPQDDAKPREQFLSNYLDAPNTPEFPFGFGLSYTRFNILKPALSAAEMSMNGSIEVTATLANQGDRDGEEVVQLYVHDIAGSVTRPVRELKGFAKVYVRKHGSVPVSFTLRPADLAFTKADMSFDPEPGRFEVFLGNDSNAPKIGEFELK
ncbi:MAG: beta-glucosidase BglX [Opitutaceae bacterium]|jgi:beta-glucosidase